MLRRMRFSGTRKALPTSHGTSTATTPWLPDSPLDMTGSEAPAMRASVAAAVVSLAVERMSRLR